MGTIAQLFETGEHAALKGHFHNLVMLARVDGTTEDTEKKLLNRIAERLSLTAEEVESICNDEDSYPMYAPVSKEERFERFIQLVQMVLVDEKVSDSEMHLITKYGVELGIDSHDIELLGSKVIGQMKNGISKEEILTSLL